MDIQITTIYCLTDDWLRCQNHREEKHCKLSNAEVLTIAIVAARFFKANFETAHAFMLEYGYIKQRLSPGQFNRRLHRLTGILEVLFERLAQVWKQTEDETIFVLDSCPVSVCDNIRIPRCKIYQNEAFRGYSSSKKRYFYGLKVHMMVNQSGRPVEVFLTPVSASDTAELKNFHFNLERGSTVYGDKAYNEYETEDLLNEVEGINLLPIRKSNSKRKLLRLSSICSRIIASALRRVSVPLNGCCRSRFMR